MRDKHSISAGKILSVYVDSTAEGSESILSDLEVLLCEGDTDDGDAKENTDKRVEEPNADTAASEPECVRLGMILEVAVNTLTEGPNRETCKLNELESDGNKDDGDAVKHARDEVERSVNKSAKDKPYNVTKSFHCLVSNQFIKNSIIILL